METKIHVYSMVLHTKKNSTLNNINRNKDKEKNCNRWIYRYELVEDRNVFSWLFMCKK